jgi:hypothetical protein
MDVSKFMLDAFAGDDRSLRSCRATEASLTVSQPRILCAELKIETDEKVHAFMTGT